MNWLQEIEQVFDTLNVDASDRVKFAVGCLKGRVLFWWNFRRLVFETAVADSMIWEKFGNRIKDKHLTAYDLERLKWEFMNISEGNRSVEACNAEFTDKLRFANNWVLTETGEDQVLCWKITCRIQTWENNTNGGKEVRIRKEREYIRVELLVQERGNKWI